MIQIPWKLSDIDLVPKNGLKVFSCFSCGGGSSMGYKLAGFDVLGGCEIDPEMASLYRENLKPKLLFEMPVQNLNPEGHEELFNLDILDGSPPCSVFSMSGNREGDWGKERSFREGQSKQRLDDLFFHFISLAKKLQPKIVVAENVKGLISGNARGYVKEIFEAFSDAGYETQLFLLNASRMGVPQFRERVFFIAKRKNLNLPQISLVFNEPPIPVSKAFEGCSTDGKALSEKAHALWGKVRPGESFSKAHPNGSWFNRKRIHPNYPASTFIATCGLTHWSEPRRISIHEGVRIQSFPEDYNFLKADPLYVMGMSVPPLMMNRLAAELAKALLYH